MIEKIKFLFLNSDVTVNRQSTLTVQIEGRLLKSVKPEAKF